MSKLALLNKVMDVMTATDNAVITALTTEYGTKVADNAKAFITVDKATNASYIIKAESAYNIIEDLKTSQPEKDFKGAQKKVAEYLDITTTDISRLSSIYANVIYPLCMHYDDITDNATKEKDSITDKSNNDDKTTAMKKYLANYTYAKCIELAKLSNRDIQYIMTEYHDTLYTLSVRELIFCIGAYGVGAKALQIEPLGGRDNEFKTRFKHVADGKKIEDYNKQTATKTATQTAQTAPQTAPTAPTALQQQTAPQTAQTAPQTTTPTTFACLSNADVKSKQSWEILLELMENNNVLDSFLQYIVDRSNEVDNVATLQEINENYANAKTVEDTQKTAQTAQTVKGKGNKA